jgi:hypothetical protein
MIDNCDPFTPSVKAALHIAKQISAKRGKDLEESELSKMVEVALLMFGLPLNNHERAQITLLLEGMFAFRFDQGTIALDVTGLIVQAIADALAEAFSDEPHLLTIALHAVLAGMRSVRGQFSANGPGGHDA